MFMVIGPVARTVSQMALLLLPWPLPELRHLHRLSRNVSVFYALEVFVLVVPLLDMTISDLANGMLTPANFPLCGDLDARCAAPRLQIARDPRQSHPRLPLDARRRSPAPPLPRPLLSPGPSPPPEPRLPWNLVSPGTSSPPRRGPSGAPHTERGPAGRRYGGPCLELGVEKRVGYYYMAASVFLYFLSGIDGSLVHKRIHRLLHPYDDPPPTLHCVCGRPPPRYKRSRKPAALARGLRA